MYSLNQAKQSGFTIVELLIVIVVVGILATLTIVSYSGITARANTVKAQTNASNVQKVAEAYNADTGHYPSALADFTTGSTSTKLPGGITVVAGGSTLDADNGDDTIGWECLGASCSSTNAGGRVTYWDFTDNSVEYVYVGSAASGGTFSNPT